MIRRLNKFKNNWGDNRDYHWQYNEEESNYTAIKKLAIAVVIFTIIYCAHISETFIGQAVDDGVRYMVNTPTDFQYILERAAAYAPANLDLSMLKKVQAVVSKPADPLQYMTKPVNGKIVTGFGWHMNPALKQETMHEGLDIEAPLGASVYAAAPGKVKMIVDTVERGKTIIIGHGQDVDTVYGNLGEVLVKQGDDVSQGQIISKLGKQGATGRSILYFEVRDKGKAINPVDRLKGEAAFSEGK